MSWELAETVSSIPERFAAQVRRDPAKTAIAGTAWSPSFAELDAASNRIAAELIERGARPGRRVAVLMRHDAPLIAAKIAVLKAGATVVVLNPADPPARIGRVREDITPTLLVGDSENRALAVRAGFPQEAAVVVADEPDDSPHPPPGILPDPDEIAQLMCTSGSTGRPVAVMQSHRNILHNVLRHTNGLGLRVEDRIVLLASPSGGQGAGTVWTALCNGATLCPFPVAERGMTGLAQWLEEQQVTVLVASASLFRHFLATLHDGVALPAVRLVRLGSERALASDHEGWREHFSPACLFANTYSSSETGAIAQHLIDSTARPGAGRLPAGRLTEGIEVIVRAGDGAPAACGVTGEILVRSRHISAGYWGEGELTAGRFELQDDGSTLFRTGDLGYRDEDGLLTVLGRADDLVKVRGNRVSLAEVETSLSALPGVHGAAVLAEESPGKELRLRAYVAHGSAPAPSTAQLRGELRGSLPDHAVPSSFLYLEQLPLTSHGKVDRERLAGLDPPPAVEDQAGVSVKAPSAPVGETEELIAALWVGVLDREDFGRGYDFFELGGDSLAAAQVAVKIEEALGVQIGIRAFAREPTIAGLARLVARLRTTAGGESEMPLAPAPADEPKPASFAQESIWRQCQTPQVAAGWVLAASVRLRGELDVELLRASLEHCLRRHPALRTTFPVREGRLLQVIHPPMPLELPCSDVSRAPDPGARVVEMLAELASEPFDLAQGPLLRLALVRLGEEEHELLRVNHHITCDGPSWQIFMGELRKIYEAGNRGERPPLGDEPALDYGDVAAWQRRRVEPGGRRHRELLERWQEAQRERATAPPFARPSRIEGLSPEEGRISWGLPADVTAGLTRIGAEVGASFYMVRLAIFAALLAAETGERELMFGTYVTTRRQPETLEMFGCFTQMAALRLSVPVEVSVREWLRVVRTAVIEVNESADLPYQALAEELGRIGVRLPGVELMFAVKEVQSRSRFAGLEMHPPEHTLAHYMPSGFNFFVDRDRELDDCRTDFDAAIYDPVLVGGFIDAYRRLAAALHGELDRPLSELVEQSAKAPPVDGSADARAGRLRRLWSRRSSTGS